MLREIWSGRFEMVGSPRTADDRREDQIRVILAVDATLTDEQRRHAVDTVDRRIRKLRQFLG